MIHSGARCVPNVWLNSYVTSAAECIPHIRADSQCDLQASYFNHAGGSGGDGRCGCLTGAVECSDSYNHGYIGGSSTTIWTLPLAPPPSLVATIVMTTIVKASHLPS